MGIFGSLKTLLPQSKEASPAVRPGRNDTCWCGSGKKYKKCHLEADERKLKPAACYGST